MPALHFLELVAAALGISTDVVVLGIALSSLSSGRLVGSSAAESSMMFLASIAWSLYGLSQAITGIAACYISCAIASCILLLVQLRAVKHLEASGWKLISSFRGSQLVGTLVLAVAAFYAVVMVFWYSDKANNAVVTGYTSALFLILSAVPLLARSIWPQEETMPPAGEALVVCGRILTCALWVMYGLIAGQPVVAVPHFFWIAASVASAMIQRSGLALPPKAQYSSSAMEALWGSEAPYVPNSEDTASPFEQLFFGWVKPFATAAAKEKLGVDNLPQPTKMMRTRVIAQDFSAQMRKEVEHRQVWDSYVARGATATVTWSRESSGKMRWIGYLPRSLEPNTVMVGIEWQVKPQIDSFPVPWPISNTFHDGTVDGEFLFSPQSAEPNNCSCLPARCVIVTSEPEACLESYPKAPSVVRALFTSTWNHIWIQVPFRVCADICMLSSPVVLEYFVKFLKSDHPTFVVGFALVFAVFGINLCQSSLLHRYYHLSIRAGIVQRNALLGALFEKCFLVSTKALAHPDMSAGRIVNMVSSDAERFNDFQQMLLFFWSYPFQVVCGIGLLYRLVGWCAVGSIMALAVAIPLQRKVADLQHKYRIQLVHTADQRVKLTNELFSGIRIVKFMGWEKNFFDRIESQRKTELRFLKSAQYCRILSALITAATPSMLVGAVFVLYHLGGHELTPEVVFPTISVLNLLRIPFIMIPNLFTTVIQFQVAANRITKFLESDEQQEGMIQPIEHYLTPTDGEKAPSSIAAALENVTLAALLPIKLSVVEREVEVNNLIDKLQRNCKCTHQPRMKTVSTKGQNHYAMQLKPLLSNVTVRIPRGKLTVIIGPTGSGKSTLLESLIGQLEITEGSAFVTSSIAFVPQQPWIMNATVRNNILFFSPLEDELFRNVLDCCELQADLATLPAGLDTEIGEKGVNLSGGQRARVSVARAVYARKELYLLDDPLSALDAHVGAALMSKCILGSLKETTRILATHQVHVLPKADLIIELSAEGAVQFVGTYAEYSGAVHKPIDSNGDDLVNKESQAGEAAASQQGKLMSTEEKATGSVSMATYFQYFKACGGVLAVLFVVLIFAVTEFLLVGNTVWLSVWSVQSFSLSQNTYLLIYIAVISVGIVCAPARYRVAYDVMRRASFVLHHELLSSVIIAPMSFFDTTPLGRILNRFVQDVDQLDNGLQMSVVSTLQIGFSALSTTIMILAAQPIALVVLLPCCVVYYKLLIFYNAANREARRIGNVVRSPVFSLLTEVLGGSKTIRAFRKTGSIMTEAVQRLDVIYSASYLQNVLNRWLGVRIELLGNAIVSTVALGTAFGKLYGVGQGSVAVLALGLTMSTTITTMLNWIVRQVSTVESDMNSIERIIHYVDEIPHEELAISDSSSPSHIRGTLAFENATMAYRVGLPNVLDGLTFRIEEGEKVGVVGRTGSGKSSLLLTILRIVNLSAGRMLIGDVDAKSLSLNQLRMLFAMIPQDPVLFDGTLKSNLDPFGDRTDSEILKALEMVGLQEKCGGAGVNNVVLDGGSNFSVGQRQLLCLARAILKKDCRFILMDEATANIDPALDKLIQNTVREAFGNQTVITIAHRLQTVANYDKIIVMDQGRVAEIGSPAELVAMNGRFRALIATQEPKTESDILAMIAMRSCSTGTR